jgi:hypothetical protein
MPLANGTVGVSKLVFFKYTYKKEGIIVFQIVTLIIMLIAGLWVVLNVHFLPKPHIVKWKKCGEDSTGRFITVECKKCGRGAVFPVGGL